MITTFRTRRPMVVAASAIAAGLALASLTPVAAQAAPVAGATTSGDSLFPNVGNGGYDVSHYDLDIAYDFVSKAIDATATITADAATELSSFSLDFEGLIVDSITVDGAAATSEREEDLDAQKHKLIVTPASPVSGKFVTVVEYSGVPTEHIDPDGSSEGWVATDDGASAPNEPVGAMTWYPNNNTPTDKATFDIDVTIPTQINGKTSGAASNGELTSRIDNGDGTTTWSWSQKNQMATYLSLVSIGQFDFYQSQITLGSGRTIPEWSFIDSNASATRKSELAQRRASIKGVIDFLESKLGPYPGNSTGLVFDRTSLGYALETQDRSYFEGRVGVATFVHEMAHQWLGDDVSPTDWSDIWLNEGPATFFEGYYDYGTAGGASPEDDWFAYWNETDESDPLWEVPVAGFDDPADLFGSATYDRGGMTLGALRVILGADGLDELFRTWVKRYAGSDASTADFTALAEELSGRDLDAFFTDWLYETGKPAWPLASSFPTLSGTAAVGSTVTAKTGTWTEGTAFTYQWKLDGTDVAGATSSTFTPSPSDAGKALTVTVTGTLADRAPTTLTSAAAKVAVGSTSSGETSVSGTPRVGSRLTVTPGTWADGTTLSYQWVAGGVPIAGATGTSIAIPAALLGKQITVEVTGTRPGYATTSVSASASGPVLRGVMHTPKKPMVKGTLRVGKTLKSSKTAWGTGTKATYIWHVGSKVVKKSTSPTLGVKKAYKGKSVRLVVVIKKTGYTTVTVKSPTTKKIK
jgi:hypothetical protein